MDLAAGFIATTLGRNDAEFATGANERRRTAGERRAIERADRASRVGRLHRLAHRLHLHPAH
ncbi:hypothetical protein MUN74_12260 [Agromyces endophyticus]|uniref:hypothetical protein n=1 Tax=Agromyces sp. H17E-10 TaxID=2932244 RepID=UPI001FD309C4|nr:hypothetical protein [Agromyces sp. H17E-10]UOQ88065.1 hypothetical protein MUN74_12260 [Agromyces sp. H17E-10]